MHARTHARAPCNTSSSLHCPSPAAERHVTSWACTSCPPTPCTCAASLVLSRSACASMQPPCTACWQHAHTARCVVSVLIICLAHCDSPSRLHNQLIPCPPAAAARVGQSDAHHLRPVVPVRCCSCLVVFWPLHHAITPICTHHHPTR